MKTITLCGETFEVHKSKYASEESLYRYAGRTLDHCYANPSTAKKSIYNEWREWAYDCNVELFGVSSYNAHRFSLQGLVQHLGHTYILSITASSNKAYIID